MGNPSFSRRDFFRSFTVKKETNSDDPLFDKYSRKSQGPRIYTNELISHNNSSERIQEDGLRIGNITSGLAPFVPISTNPWNALKAMHLLRRTGFGFKYTDVAVLVKAGSPSAAVDIILNINNTAPKPPVNWYQTFNASSADAGGVAYGADWTKNALAYVNDATSPLQQNTNSYRNDGVRQWMFGQALNQDITIKEKMTWFWYHFLPIDFEVVANSSYSHVSTNSARIFYSYFKMLRDYSGGNFKTIIRNMTRHPAMMFYLNNEANSAEAPDENFARELMELFTLGKDPLSQYTQSDVVAAAHVLSGWRVQNLDTVNPVTNFEPAYHKTGPKQFSSFFNNAIIQNSTPSILANGALELDAFIDLIFSKTKVVSEYICRRLYRYFVYYDIDANVEANIIIPLAKTFVANNWNIMPVLKQLFKSNHFFDIANLGVCIKSPFDLIIGSLKHLNINCNVVPSTNFQAQYSVWEYFNNKVSFPMEQKMGTIPTVSGWNAYYQIPAFHEYWINTNTIQKRFIFLDKILISGYRLNYNSLVTFLKIDVIAYVKQFNDINIGNPNELVAACIKYLLPLDLNVLQKNNIKQHTLLYQQITDGYWTAAWTDYIAAPTNTSYKAIVTGRLTSLLYTIIQLAEYQLM